MRDNQNVDRSSVSYQREKALSRWDGEGGAGPAGPQHDACAGTGIPELTSTELVQLRIRVIALENLMIALLAQVSNKQIEHAREMATFISPRAGFTPHPLTIHAADQMKSLVDRASHFRDV